MIKCLPADVQSKLRSGVAIPSLQQCVEELLLNSIDAGATCVGVRMDMESLKVQVIDNGDGMSADEMKCVGNRYFTSKCSSLEDLDNLRWYGFRGEALASILSLATLVEISSRTRSSVKTHVKMFKNGKGMDVFEAETTRPSAGTTVVICSFFHNMPVRRRRLDAVLEAERIRHRVEAISLMHPSVSFTLKNDCTGVMMVQLSKARNTYHRFVQIHGVERAQKLGEIDHKCEQFEVAGYVCREGHYNGSLQFLFVNGRLLLKTRIHKLLNLLLRKLNSLNQKNDSPDEHSALRSPKQKRGQDLNGVYVINIKCSYSEYDICLEPAKTLIEFKDWDGILLCIEEAVDAFLRRENLFVGPPQDDVHSVPPQLIHGDNASQEEDNRGREATSSTRDCSIGISLASESVYRPRRDASASKDIVCQKSDLMECDEGEAEKIYASDLERMQSEGCVNEDCRNEPRCDLAQLHPASDNNITEGSENPQVCEEKETRLNRINSTGNVTLPDSITQQIKRDVNCTDQSLSDCQGAGGHRQPLCCNRKITLSDPFLHKSLQTFNKSLFQHQKAQERSFSSKCKISLDSRHDRQIPSKLPRFEPSRKLSLWEASGSLDKFRRMFCTPDDMKLPSVKTQSQSSAGLPQPISSTLPPQNLLVCQTDHQDGDATQTYEEETGSSLPSPETLSNFTELRPASAHKKGKKSLAAKLCHLKQSTPLGSQSLPDVFESTSKDSICLSGSNDIQDSNNNENPCATALNDEPASGCSKSPQSDGKEEGTASADWLHHYDTSVGKMVYVNRVTGLSKYEDPCTEETQVRCTTDITNMAVSVISDTGMEYRCYPFQVDLVLPFLPNSKTGRVISSGLEGRDDGDDTTNSLSSLYSKWNNPVFVQPPMVGMDISNRQADGLAVKIHNILFPYRFSKAMVQSMKVICQVDKKFLACLINTRDEESAALSGAEGNLLVLVDQHAAHERVRLENLVADSFEDDPVASGERRLGSSNILPPLEITVTEGELRLLRSCQAHLQNLGLEVKFSQAAEPQVFVEKVPLCFLERESNELKRGRPSVIKAIVEEYLREQIELLHSAGRVRGTLPLTVLKVLASLACHGAIKFNHSLSRDECHNLVAALSSCQLPFQCAHGRPSIIPLVDLLHLDKDQKEPQKPNLQKLKRKHKAWELYGNR